MKYRLSECIELIGGGTPKTSIESYWNGDIPWLSVKDFNNDKRYVYKTEKSITEDGLNNSSTKLLEKDDIIVSARGTVGEMSMIPFPMAFNQSCYGIRAKSNIVESTYLYYLLKNSINEIKSKTHGSVFDTITRETFSKIEVELPDIPIQRKISKFLGCIDDKIEMNSKLNDSLEELAKLYFEDKLEKYIGQEDIPKGWKYVELGELIEVIDNRGKTPPLEICKTAYPIIDVKALSGNTRIVNFENCTKYVNEETYNTWFRSGHPKPLDILISTVGSLAEMKIFNGDVGCIAQNVVAFRCYISQYYLFQYLKHIKNDLVSYNIGSVQPSIKVTHVVKHKILVPEDNEIIQINNLLEAFTEQIYKNSIQIETLKNIRDTLLPKLISGEINLDNFDLDI